MTLQSKEAMRTKPKCIKSGSLILFRDGHTGMVICCNSKYFIMHKKEGSFVNRLVMERYTENLLHLHDSTQDIMKVVAPTGSPYGESSWERVLDTDSHYGRAEITFQRKEGVISIAELADLLGCKPEEVIITGIKSK